MAGAAQAGTFGVYVVMNPRTLDRILSSTNGPVARDLMWRGQNIKRRAQELVGVYVPADSRRVRKPGTLRDSIVTRLVRTGGKDSGLSCIVGSHDPIALWHHEGTVPHVITATKPHGMLVWRSAQQKMPEGVYGPGKLGNLVVVRGRGGAPGSVNHPGTQPNRYLTEALPAGRG